METSPFLNNCEFFIFLIHRFTSQGRQYSSTVFRLVLHRLYPLILDNLELGNSCRSTSRDLVMSCLGESSSTNPVINDNNTSKLLCSFLSMIPEYKILAVFPGNIYDPTFCLILVHLPHANISSHTNGLTLQPHYVPIVIYT